MTIYTRTVAKLLAVTALSMSMPAVAQTGAQPTSRSKMEHGPSMTEGEVRKVDQDAGKVTIKHGEIKNLDMPPMTMVFVAQDKALLANLQAGEKIQFSAEQGAGQFLVTDIKPLK